MNSQYRFMYYPGLVPVEIGNDVQQFWQYVHVCCLINQWCHSNSYGFEDFTSLHPDRQQLIAGLALDQTLFDTNVSDSQNMENFEEEMSEQIRIDTITPEEEFEDFVEELVSFSDASDEEDSFGDVIQPKPCKAAMSATGDATTASTGHATKSYADVVGRNNLPNLVGAGAGVPTSETSTVESGESPETEDDAEIIELEEEAKKAFFKQGDAWKAVDALSKKKNYFPYTKGMERIDANDAHTPSDRFKEILLEMKYHEDVWFENQRLLDQAFKALQARYPERYQRLNVLTVRWIPTNPACPTYDYPANFALARAKYTKHGEIRKRLGI